MFEEVFGAFVALNGFGFCCFKGAGGCRWLMHDEMLGAFIFSFGNPG